jgi:hypothetical protein
MAASRRYKITQDRWCWCGRPAALVVAKVRGGEVLEPVCSNEHGAMSIEWLEAKDD